MSKGTKLLTKLQELSQQLVGLVTDVEHDAEALEGQRDAAGIQANEDLVASDPRRQPNRFRGDDRPLATKKDEDPTEPESDFMADFDSATKTLTPGLFTSTRDVEELTRLDDVQSHQIVHLETI